MSNLIEIHRYMANYKFSSGSDSEVPVGTAVVAAYE